MSAREAAPTMAAAWSAQLVVPTAIDVPRLERTAHSADASRPEHATTMVDAPESSQAPTAVPLKPLFSERDVAALRSEQQLPAPPPRPAAAAQKDLPELVCNLVQTVVHLSRGREGQWRLTMALKPQVLEGTVVELTAQPGSLRVRFNCAGADARARLTAVRGDLHQRLGEALSAVRPVDVRVDVRAADAGALA